ncbi:MAG: pitrilysin family protein [Terrimicrobiaceae bacterium]
MNRFFLLSCMLVTTTFHAPAKSPADQSPSLVPTTARKHTLPNGVTVIIEEDRSAPVASLQAWCGTGSIHEGKWLGAGLSHILEHMLFKGTAKRPAGEIARQIQDQGGGINAYTSFDRTVYWIDVPATGATQALDILADAVLNSTLPEEEYTKEQEVIRREFAMGFDDVNRQSSQLMLRTVFGESPFRHPVIGYLDVYNKLTREDVMEYYRTRYVPNNLTFVISGDVDGDAILKQLEEVFKDIPRGALEPVFVASEPEQLGRRDGHEEFAATELSRLNLAWRIPGLDNPDTPALEVLGEVLGSGRSSPLNQDLREKQRLVHQVASGMFSLQSDGVFVIQAVTDPDKREAATEAALAVVENLKKNGPTPGELDRAKRSLLASQISGLETARGRASDLGSSWLLTKNLNFSRDYLNAVSHVTAADLVRVAHKYLRTDRLNVTSLNPVGTLQESTASAAATKKSGVQKFTLSNGLRLLVREDSRLPMVTVTATFQGGVLVETPDNNGITKLLARTLLKGTKTRSALEIAEEIEGVGGRIGSDSGNNSWSISSEVMAPDLKVAMDVVADVIANPVFEAAEFDLEKQSLLASIKAEDEQITAVARNATREAFFGDHPYALRSGGNAASVAKLSPEDLKALHAKLAVAKNGVLAVFGDVEARQVLKMAEATFGKLNAGQAAFDNLKSPVLPTEPVITRKDMDKKQAVLMFAFPSPGILAEDRAAMELINEASNDLGSRFFDRIREKMGLAYFVGAGNLAGPVPGSQIFYLGTDPAKLEIVTKEFRDEIAIMAKEGLTEDELARAKKKLLGGEAIQNQSNGAFASSVSLDELLGLGYDHHLKRAEVINAVTLEDTKRAAAKYLGAPGYVRTSVGPAGPTKTN